MLLKDVLSAFEYKHMLASCRMLPGLRSVVDRPAVRLQARGGLAGVVQAQLGQQLDKRLQCSHWGSRPLTSQQACLLANTPT